MTDHFENKSASNFEADPKLTAKIKFLQRELTKKVKFSNNWKKIKQEISSLHSKIANVRRDRLHKISTQLSKSHVIIVLEDLKIRNMTKSAKGNTQHPGKRLSRNRDLTE